MSKDIRNTINVIKSLNENHQMMGVCSNCGRHIKNIVTINGKPYGTECAQYILGQKLPKGFTGNYDDYKVEMDAQVLSALESKRRVAENWNEIWALNRILLDMRYQGNDWAVQFINSVIKQLGYHDGFSGAKRHRTYDEAVENWGQADGSFPHLYKDPRKIESLSPKQVDLLYKFGIGEYLNT